MARRLRAEDTRATTLQALEALPHVPTELALAAAPALVDTAAGTEDRDVLNRCRLLVARLLVEAAPDPAALFGAFGGERTAALFGQVRLLVEATQRALGTGSEEVGQQPLTREDAYSCACLDSYFSPAYVRGIAVAAAATGRTAMEYLRIVRDCAVPSCVPCLAPPPPPSPVPR